MTTIPRDCTSLQAERTARAAAITGKYGVEMVQPGMWVCVHPDEFDRSYIVTLTGNGAECSCPDYSMSVGKIGVECKHIQMLRMMFPNEPWLKKLAAPKSRIPGFELPILKGDQFDPWETDRTIKGETK